MMKIRACDWCGFFLVLGDAPRFHSNFTDKAGFLEHLSVKPGPNRLNFYGQKAVFDHFVRNRHFSGRPFTDKLPIFIDLSVNGSDFEFVLLSRPHAPILDQPVDKKWIRFAINRKSHPSFNLRQNFFQVSVIVSSPISIPNILRFDID